jgi:hypothetical protein
MSTFVCPTEPVQPWFPVDPSVPELPVAPEIIDNPEPEPANTYPEQVSDEDFEFITLDYLGLSSPVCFSEDWGFITDTATTDVDYKGILTIWDLLPDDTDAVPEQEVIVDDLYPPYRETIVQIFPVYILAESTRVDKRVFDLDIDPITLTVIAQVVKPTLKYVVAVIKLGKNIQELGGALPLPIRLVAETTSSPAPLRLGYTSGFVAWRSGTPEPPEFPLIDAPVRLIAIVSRDIFIDAPISLKIVVTSGVPPLPLGFVTGFNAWRSGTSEP